MSTYIVSFHYDADDPQRYAECGVDANTEKEALKNLLTEEGMDDAEADKLLEDWTPAETEIWDWYDVAVVPGWKTTCPICGHAEFLSQPPAVPADTQNHKCQCGKDAKYYLSSECNRALFSLEDPDKKVGYIPAIHKEPAVYYCEACISIANSKAVFYGGARIPAP